MKITISEEQGQKIADLAHRLTRFQKGNAEVIKVFDDWQSRQLVANKRLFGTFAFILAAVHFIRIDYSNLSFAGIKTSGGEPFRIALALSLPIVLFGTLYFVQRRADREARSVNLDDLQADMDRGLEILQEIRALAEVKDGTSVSGVTWERSSQPGKYSSLDQLRVRSIQALELYESRLRSSQSWINFVEISEPYFLTAMALYGLWGIFEFWLAGQAAPIEFGAPWGF